MRVIIDADTIQATSHLEGIERRMRDPRPAMRQVRDNLIDSHSRNFTDQGRTLADPWPALSPETIARKRREGLSAQPLVASGKLGMALLGGPGKRATASKTTISVGVQKRLFYARFHMAGAGGNRRGTQPPRRVIGINAVEELRAKSVLSEYIESGRLVR
jgi:hypothetical protein